MEEYIYLETPLKLVTIFITLWLKTFDIYIYLWLIAALKLAYCLIFNKTNINLISKSFLHALFKMFNLFWFKLIHLTNIHKMNWNST